MRVIICGGGLQGVELCFLAKQAGWQSVLIDKLENVPAAALADRFIHQDLCSLDTAQEIHELFFAIDLVIPATENFKALQALTIFCQKHNIPCAFDMHAYKITSSKLLSRELFKECNTPIPNPFEAFSQEKISFPLIAKPSGGSGSQGVQIFHETASFEMAFPHGTATEEWLFENYCEGPSYSIEVCGTPDNYTCFTVTALQMDARFDCKAVTVPSGLNALNEKLIEEEIVRLAHALQLHGIMDLEVIWTPTGYVVLEIDARFPSQTPTAVYLASGINLIEHLAACYIEYTPMQKKHEIQHVWYGHMIHNGTHLENEGEHCMTKYGSLQIHAVCSPYMSLVGQNDTPHDTSWGITLMLHDTSFERLQDLRERCIQNIKSVVL